MSGKKHRSNYDDAFKREVVNTYRNSSLTMREVAIQYGISSGMVSKWQDTIPVEEEGDISSREILELKREMKKTRDELKILKELVCKQITDKHKWLFEDSGG